MTKGVYYHCTKTLVQYAKGLVQGPDADILQETKRQSLIKGDESE